MVRIGMTYTDNFEIGSAKQDGPAEGREPEPLHNFTAMSLCLHSSLT